MQKTRMAFAAAAALAMVVAAGCGSSGNDASSGASGGSVSAAASGSASGGSAGSGSASAASGSAGSGSASSGMSGSASSGMSGSASSGSSGSGSAISGASGSATSGGDEDFTCKGKSGSTEPTELTLALVPSGNSTKLVKTAEPLTDYLTKALGIPVKGVVSQNYAGAVEAMGANQAQIGLFAPLPMIQACQKYGAKIELQAVRYGSTTYHTQFMTNDPDKYCTISKPVPKKANKDYLNCNGTADTTKGPIGLETLKNMGQGTKISLLDPSSSSGYIFPVLAMLNQGIKPKDDLDVVQLEGHDQSVLAVYNKDVEVGVSYDDARDAVVEDNPDVGKKVVVFAYSTEIPNDGMVVSGDLTSEWQQKITKTIEDYSNTDAGKKVLGAIYQIDSLAPAEVAAMGKVAEAVQKLGLTG